MVRNKVEMWRLCGECLLWEAADALTAQLAQWLRLLFDVQFFGFAAAFLNDVNKRIGDCKPEHRGAHTRNSNDNSNTLRATSSKCYVSHC